MIEVTKVPNVPQERKYLLRSFTNIACWEVLHILRLKLQSILNATSLITLFVIFYSELALEVQHLQPVQPLMQICL